MSDNRITDVFFDLDHTLWDFDRNSALAFQRVFQKHKIELELSVFLKEYEPINLRYWRKYREEKVGKLELRRGRLIDAFAEFNMEFPIETIDAMAESYIEELPGDNFLFDGAIDILDYLFSKYTLHIITNGFEEVQQLKLQNSGILKYFMTVTTSEEVGVKKPNPLVFETALKKATALPSNSTMIGDSLEADIVGADAVGMHTLYFNYKREVVAKDYKSVEKLCEIKNYL